MHLAITNVNKGADVAAQIEQRMHLDGGLGCAEHRPRKYRQTQIDSRGVERVDGFLQIDAEGLLRIQRPGDTDGGIDEPRAILEKLSKGTPPIHQIAPRRIM